jgi:hypothetical protein
MLQMCQQSSSDATAKASTADAASSGAVIASIPCSCIIRKAPLGSRETSSSIERTKSTWSGWRPSR